MAQWGNSDVASNSSLQWLQQLQVTPNTTNRTAAFGNTSAWYAGNKGVAGIFAASAAETAVLSGNVAILRVSNAGSGYSANAAVTITATNGGTSATANATANATGRISALNISAAGSGYKTNPTITIAAPAPISFSGNSTSVTVGNSSVNGYITLGSNTTLFANGDAITYLVAASNTAITGLANNTTYYVIIANTTAIQLETSVGGGAINLASVAAGAQAGHSITGTTATGYAAIGGGENKGVTAGWNLRTAGTGGRAGRVQYECLVAMRSITGDASDDSILPDA
jgi:hypothetical protein